MNEPTTNSEHDINTTIAPANTVPVEM